MSNNCPICNKDDAIQKLSVIVSSGKSSGTFSGPSGGVVRVDGKWGATGGYSTLSGSTISDLARRLAPPPAPTLKRINWPLAILFAISALITGCFTIYGFMLSQGKFIIPLILFISTFVIYQVLTNNYLKKAKVIYQQEKSHWGAALEKWNRLYFCHRDGIVFDPDTQETCQPDNLTQFVYSSSLRNTVIAQSIPQGSLKPSISPVSSASSPAANTVPPAIQTGWGSNNPNSTPATPASPATLAADPAPKKNTWKEIG